MANKDKRIDPVLLKSAQERISKAALHVLLTAYWELFYEPFIHGMTRDEMTALCQTAAKLIDWKRALGLSESLPD